MGGVGGGGGGRGEARITEFMKIIVMSAGPASERTRNNLKKYKDYYLKAKARIWPGLSHMCHIRSTSGRGTDHRDDGHELHDDVQRGARGVLQRVAHLHFEVCLSDLRPSDFETNIFLVSGFTILKQTHFGFRISGSSGNTRVSLAWFRAEVFGYSVTATVECSTDFLLLVPGVKHTDFGIRDP